MDALVRGGVVGTSQLRVGEVFNTADRLFKRRLASG